MTFATPCFVRVENAEKRKELVKWCMDIGYDVTQDPYELSQGSIVTTTTEKVWVVYSRDIAQLPSFIDCGIDVELFKALSAMNAENDREQWFTDGIHFEKSMHDVAGIASWEACYHMTPRKATIEEIIEHFKNK